MKKYLVYTDGSAKGNPDGPGGYGCVIIHKGVDGRDYTQELSEGFPKTTNNRMELLGVIAALEAVEEPSEFSIVSDSKYVVDAFNQGWILGWLQRGWVNSKREPVKNKDLWLRLLTQISKHNVSFKWVKGHAGNHYNEICDRLACEAAEKARR